MIKRFWRATCAALLVSTLLLLPVSVASAHEGREVGGFHFVAGWGEEPAYAGFKNSVQLILTDRSDKPVVDLRDTLKVEVIFGTETKSVPLEPNFEVGEFGQPGDYRAWLIPTRAGTYTFHFTGNVKGQNVDEKFTSSDKTFDDLKEPTDVQFPAKDPSNAQLSERLQRDTGRLQKEDADRAQTLRSDLNSKASLATYLAIAAGVLAILGLVLGFVGMRRRG
jgi:hypothetical protein